MTRTDRIDAMAGEIVAKMNLTGSDALPQLFQICRRHVEEIIKNEPRLRSPRSRVDRYYVLKFDDDYVTNASNGYYTSKQHLASRFWSRPIPNPTQRVVKVWRRARG